MKQKKLSKLVRRTISLPIIFILPILAAYLFLLPKEVPVKLLENQIVIPRYYDLILVYLCLVVLAATSLVKKRKKDAPTAIFFASVGAGILIITAFHWLLPVMTIVFAGMGAIVVSAAINFWEMNSRKFFVETTAWTSLLLLIFLGLINTLILLVVYFIVSYVFMLTRRIVIGESGQWLVYCLGLEKDKIEEKEIEKEKTED
ncbi:MAG: hypothetical protein ACOX0C_01610 [Patescibacteria group bacterium]|jgi:hypothetical protein